MTNQANNETKSNTNTKAKSKTTRLPKAGKPVEVHAFLEGKRPTGGKLLKAHTAATLEYFGMMNPARPKASRSALQYVWGERAYRYHTKIENIETEVVQTNEGPITMVRLTTKGFNFFGDRKKQTQYADEDKSSYVEMMKSGKLKEGTKANGGMTAIAKDLHSQEFVIKVTR